MATNFTKELMVKPGKKVRLGKFDPDETLGWDKNHAMKVSLDKAIKTLDHSQYLLYADHKHALLIVFQGRDAAGKDGTIRHVMSGVNPQGCTVTSFKTPSPEEAAHDYLWRVHHAVPEYGNLGIFNRSHYEDVLIVRVHNLVPKAVWSERYDQINEFEKYLVDNNVKILKFFLHISKKEQKKRFMERVNDPTSAGKFPKRISTSENSGTITPRRTRMRSTRCSTKVAPWFMIPANKKWFRNLAVSHIIAETLEEMKLKFPRADD